MGRVECGVLWNQGGEDIVRSLTPFPGECGADAGGRLDYAMSKYASRIRRLAGSDGLISAGGVAGFVQAVLAPELAVMLVKDDMNVDEEQAREILKESSEVGNLLNEEEDEMIKDAVVEMGSRDESGTVRV